MQLNPMHSQKSRPGAVTPLVALLMVFVMGVIAFAVDLGYIILVQSDLQNAADAAALAGADPLMQGYVDYHLPNQSTAEKTAILNNTLTTARNKAKEYAAYNSAGDAASLVLRDTDIEFGYTDAAGTYTQHTNLTPNFPNTIKVLLRRDTLANNRVTLFFAPVIGTDSTRLGATASATIYGGVLETINPNKIPKMLPMAYDIDDWNNFLLTGQDPDGNTSLADNGKPQIKVYESNKHVGNFGQLSLDGYHAGSSEIRSWIHDGLSSGDVSSLQSLNLIPLSAQTPGAFEWRGNPGFRSSTVQAVNQYIGDTYLLPLFKAKAAGNVNGSGYEAGDGRGSNYDYNIEAFVSVTIVEPGRTNRDIVVQPGVYIDIEDVFDPASIAPVGSSSTIVTTFVAPKLSR